LHSRCSGNSPGIEYAPSPESGSHYGELHARPRIPATAETGLMLLPEARIDKTLEETLARALSEFCPAWKIASDCSRVDPSDPSHWATDTESCQVALRPTPLRVRGYRKQWANAAAEHGCQLC